MDIKKVHCLFEQSGTFKNTFTKHGIKAEDYDILNEFDETDNVIDLFEEINRAYEGKPSFFDDITTDDLIMAFFPCIRFENQIMMFFRGQAYQQDKWSLEDKMEYDMNLLDEVNSMYKLVNKLFIVCIRGGYRMILENPFSEEHFLRRYWCFLPSVIDRDRRDNGDYFKKPTQYWFLNCSPEQNILFEPLPNNGIDAKDPIRTMTKEEWTQTGASSCKVARSMIHPDYADRFVRQYVLNASEVMK